MKLKSSREIRPRFSGREILRPASEQEEGSFIPERDVHERDWQIAQILFTEAFNRPESNYGYVERMTRLAKCLALVDPKRIQEVATDVALVRLAGLARYTIGSEEQMERGKRMIWSNLKVCGIETPPPAAWSELENAMDAAFVSLHDGRDRPGWDIDMVRDVRICLQMFPDNRTQILERMKEENVWEIVLDVLSKVDYSAGWGVEFGLDLAAELCLIDPNRTAEVKAILQPHWSKIMNTFKNTQKIGYGFELFDPKETLEPVNKKKLMSIHANEIYECRFFEMAAALTILSVEAAEIDGQGRIKLTKAKERAAAQPKLPERLVA